MKQRTSTQSVARRSGREDKRSGPMTQFTQEQWGVRRSPEL
jgi:hypothetical protein